MAPLKEIVSTAAEVWGVQDEHVLGRLAHFKFAMPRTAAVVVAHECGYPAATIAVHFDRAYYGDFVKSSLARSRGWVGGNSAYAYDLAELRSLFALQAPPVSNPFLGFFRTEHLAGSVGRAFGVSASVVMGKCRFQQVIHARAVVYRLLRDMGVSTPRIGAKFNRDHSTVLNALGKFEGYAKYHPKVRAVYEHHCALREAANG